MITIKFQVSQTRSSFLLL